MSPIISSPVTLKKGWWTDYVLVVGTVRSTTVASINIQPVHYRLQNIRQTRSQFLSRRVHCVPYRALSQKFNNPLAAQYTRLRTVV